MYYKRAGMRNKRFVIQSKHAALFNKFKHSLQTKTRCVTVERKFSMDLWACRMLSHCTNAGEKCARYAKLGRINEIISAAESLL